MKYLILFALVIFIQVLCNIFPKLDFILNCVGLIIIFLVVLKIDDLSKRIDREYYK